MSSKSAAGKFQRDILRALARTLFSRREISDNFQGIRSVHSFHKSIDGLISKGLIELSGEKFRITKAGKLLIENIDKEEITLNREKWDGDWKIVAYDIPESLKKERDHFRRKLESLDFTKIQASMWLMPYECREEIAILAGVLGVSDYVIYLKTDHVPQNSKYLKKYNL